MAIIAINQAGTVPAGDIAYFDGNGDLQTVPDGGFDDAEPSARAFVDNATSGDTVVATEAFDDSVLFQGFGAKNLNLHVNRDVKTDSSDVINGYRLTNIANGVSWTHENGGTYSDVMFVQSDATFRIFDISSSALFTANRCLFKHGGSSPAVQVQDAVGTTKAVFRNNIIYSSGAIFFSLLGASNDLIDFIATNNIAHGCSNFIRLFMLASAAQKPLAINNVTLANTADSFGVIPGWDPGYLAGTAENYADGDSTNPGTGGGDISTSTDFVTSVTDLACKDEDTADLYLGVDLSADHNLDFNLIVPSKWVVGATDFAGGGGSGGGGGALAAKADDDVFYFGLV